MRLNKVFLQGKKSAQTCEDGHVFSEHYAAVVDGVTSKSEKLFSGKTPGRIGMEVVCREIPRLAEDMTVEQAVCQLTMALREERERMAQEHEVTLLEYPRAISASTAMPFSSAELISASVTPAAAEISPNLSFNSRQMR